MRTIQDSVEVLSGVGAKRLEALHSLGIYSIYDLITHFPFRYEDIQVRSLDEIEDQEKVTLKGRVVTQPVVQHYGYRKSRLSFKLALDSAVIGVTFFNQPYLKDKIHLEEEIAIFGKWDGMRQNLGGFKLLGSSGDQDSQDFESVYHVNKSIKQKTLLTLIQSAVEDYYAMIPEVVPESLRQQYRLMYHKDAIKAIHFPQTQEEFQQATRQIVYQEFLIYQLKLQLIRFKRKASRQGQPIIYDVEKLKQFIQVLPFELTDGQKKVVNEICRDLRAPFEMNRLLQGDVGSGKTVVAVIALVATILGGYQGAFMVPTEILAEQHYQTIGAFFADTDYSVALLTGSTKTKARREILQQLADGSLDLVIGTHALIQDDVVFHRLGLVITDEQHRFGVNQRQKLNEKGTNPNVLYMTATPIPRTLAITLMGEMDVSVLAQMPDGRIPIRTVWSKSDQLLQALTFIAKELRKGRQAYIITPLIEKSELIDLKNAEEMHQKVVDFYKGEWEIGLLHGRQKPEEKDAIMHAFKDNRYQVLVSTTVIEVGLNVPNANVMVIQDAERFGLAQLHQLRGRVGRGSAESYCLLLANPKTEIGKERMQIMTESTDGFYLSQKDLELRGSGDVFGVKQAGMPEFKYADVIKHAEVLETANRDVILMLSDQTFFEDPEFTSLRNYLESEENLAKKFQ